MKLIFIPGPWRELGTRCAKDRMPALKAERPAILRKLQAFQAQTADELYAERRKFGCPNHE